MIIIFKTIQQQILNILIYIKNIFIWPYNYVNSLKYN